MVATTVREALRDAMAEEMRRDPDVFIMGEEVAEYQGAYKITQGLLAALVADAVPAERAGTAFGFFNLVTGLFLLLASSLAGLLWGSLGPPATFLAGAAFSVVALAGLAFHWRRQRRSAPAPPPSAAAITG